MPITVESVYRPKRAEWLGVLIILLGMFVLNISTYNLYPTVWADEILWSEPAINLDRTGHFTTSVWQFQRAGSFWAAQSPLYCFALSGWLPLVGESVLAVRSFNLVLMTIATFLIWFASWRYQLLSRPWHRMLMVLLLLTGYGISFSYRCSRPDIAGLVTLLCLGLAFSARNRTRKDYALFLVAATAPWVGLQVGLFAFLACAAAKFIFRGVSYRDLVIVSTGLFVGGCSLLLFFYANGVLPDFMASISQATHEHMHWGHASSYAGSVPRRLRSTVGIYLEDFSCIPLIFGLICLRFFAPKNFNPQARRAMVFFLALFLTIPLIFSFTAHFAFYYSYMIYVPLVGAFLIFHENCFTEITQARKMFVGAIFTLVVLGAALIGLPLRLALTSSFCQIAPRTESAGIIHSRLKPEDVVFSDYESFFEAKLASQKVYSPMYSRYFVDLSPQAHDFTTEEKSKITVIIVPIASAERLKEYFGGKWAAVSEPFGDFSALDNLEKVPLIGGRLKHHLMSPQVFRQKLQIWRRVTE